MNAYRRKRDEQVVEQLRSLFEQRGFRQTSVPKFENYDLYIENKKFLQSENIITFMDLDGKLLALKPDVTLSIVKNTPPQKLAVSEKLYYLDEVYRLSRESREYKVLGQIGVELLGVSDPFSDIEIIDLALESLACIDTRYLIDLSHIGFVSEMLESAGLTHLLTQRALQAIHSRNMHDLQRLLAEEGVPEEMQNKILHLVQISGLFETTLPLAKELISNDAMQSAWDELEHLFDVLKSNGKAEHLRLDFSVVGDIDYYNGLVFKGYVEGIPKEIMTGGRYDNLMVKMGKKASAIGFAVSLSELNTYQKSPKTYDFDRLITYAENCDHAALLLLTNRLTAQGERIRLERTDADLSQSGYTFVRHDCFEGDTLNQL